MDDSGQLVDATGAPPGVGSFATNDLRRSLNFLRDESSGQVYVDVCSPNIHDSMYSQQKL